MPVLQDGPPPGGFPSVRIARRIPSTGPGGFTLFAVSTGIMAYGFYLVRPPPPTPPPLPRGPLPPYGAPVQGPKP